MNETNFVPVPKKEKKSRRPTFWSKTSFWGRFLVLAAAFFAFIASIRFAYFWEPLFILPFLLLFIGLPLGIVWLGIAAFKKESPGTKWHKPKKRITRLLVFFLVMPLASFTALGLGSAVSYAIAPISAEETAVMEARKAEQAQREKDRAQAEEAKRAAEAEQKASKAAADAAKREESERIAAEAAAQKAANDAAAQAKNNQTAADKAALEAEAKAAKRLADLQTTKPLLYAAEYCADLASKIGFSSSNYLSVDKSGTSLFVNTGSSKDNRGLFVYACVSKALEFSTPLQSSISATNALAGTRTWNENNLDLQWSYHPTSGLSLSVLKKQSCFLFVCN